MAVGLQSTVYIFGIAFLLLTGSCVRAMIRFRNTTRFTKTHISYAINAVLVLFTSSRALVFVLHGYVKVETVPAVFSSDKCLFNIGFPCLIAAYSSAIYPCLKYLKDRIRRVFEIVLVQCYVFVVAEIVETTVLDDQHISLHVHFILSASFCLFVLSVNGRNLFRSSSDISNNTKQMNSLSVQIIEETNCKTEDNDMTKRRSVISEKIVSVSILSIGVACFVIRSCIMTGNIKEWGDDIEMESWYSWVLAAVLRMIELGNAAVMSHLVQRVTLK
jgi:hypothetical protein